MDMPMTFEYAIEHNPLRALVRENLEIKLLRKASDIGPIGHGLHVACGDGSATRQILKHFPAARMSCTDRDGELVEAARARRWGDAFDFSKQDVDSLSFPDASFDAVFDLADLHNIAAWRRGLAELHRVLKPGGLLFLEELSLESFERGPGKLFRSWTEHPYDSMLRVPEFRDETLLRGFEILHFEERNPLGLLRYFVMVARKL
jgi:ubiquinone/menaquinone biosynthesis C-methylase UbiE